MELLVCAKQVPDFDMVVPADWRVGGGGEPDIGYANRIINCFDESALESALRLSDLSEGLGAPCGVSVLTVGDESADRMLKGLLALKIREAVRIHSGEDLRFAPGAVARLIAGYLQRGPLPDAILMGRQAGEGDNAQVPLLTAELLGIRCITNMTALDRGEDGRLLVRHLMTGGEREVLVKPPVLLTVGNMSGVALRSATLKEKIAARERTVTVVPSGPGTELPCRVEKFSRSRVVELFQQQQEKHCEMLEFDTPEAAARRILNEIALLGGKEGRLS